jgi:hypothetical protein
VHPKELRRLVADVDGEQNATMRAFDRRSMVRAIGRGGLALASGGAALVGAATAAGAQTTSTTAAPTTAAAPTTTTTLPPQSPQTSDLVIMGFAQSLELGLVQLYTTALATGKLDADATNAVATFQSHHRSHGQSFAGQAGKATLSLANQTLIAEYTPKLTSATTADELLRTLFDLANTFATSYTAALATIIGTNPASLMGSIQPIEARHAVVFGQMLNLEPSQYVPAFEATGGAKTPANYPIVAH